MNTKLQQLSENQYESLCFPTINLYCCIFAGDTYMRVAGDSIVP